MVIPRSTQWGKDEAMSGLHMINRAKEDAATARATRGGAWMVLLAACVAVAVALALALPQAHLHDSDGHSGTLCPTCTLLLAAGTVAIVLLSRLWARHRSVDGRAWVPAGPAVLVRATTPTPIAPRAPPAISA
jgi:hypothetical protein